MPAKTERQARFMRLCSSEEGRKNARSTCPPVKVAKEFSIFPKLAKSAEKKGSKS